LLVIYVSDCKIKQIWEYDYYCYWRVSKDYIPGRKSAHRGAKKYIAIFYDWRYIYTWLAQFVNLLPRRGAPGSVPAPTRFSEAHAVPDIAGIMEQAERRTRGKCVCRQIFIENVYDLEPVFPMCSRNMIGTRSYLWRFIAYCTYIILRWLELLFSNFQIRVKHPHRNQEFFELTS